ncbi:MAG: chaperone NapD [Pseudomonadota bacterium]
MAPEIHIAGVLVQARPEACAAVREAIACSAQAQVVQHAADGRIVVVVEAGSAGEVVQRLEAMRTLPGVLNVALVYQHAEPAAAMQQEMPT